MIRQLIHEQVQAGKDQSLELLRSLVEVNSYWGNAAGVNDVGKLALEAMPRILKRRSVRDDAGITHHILTGPAGQEGSILLVGHLDTVFPLDIESTPFEIRENFIIGPGTADMKGGVVVMIRALQILEDIGVLDRIPIQCLLNGDEEVGSPFSSGLVHELGSKARFGLVFECGGLAGEVVTGRRGINRSILTATGQARHAGVKTGPKASAIVEICRLVLALERLNNPDRGISINVGVIRGGTANNVVPDHAEATFEFRFRDRETEVEVLSEMDAIVSFIETPGCAAVIETLHRRPSMVAVPGSGPLLEILVKAGRELGQSVGTEFRGGASDGNLLSEMGVPVIDGLGPVGDMDHSPDEFIIAETLHERTALTALLLCRLAEIEG